MSDKLPIIIDGKTKILIAVRNDKMLAKDLLLDHYFINGTYYLMEDEPKQPLFTTEDGKPIYSWHDVVWFVNGMWYVGSTQAASYDSERDDFKYFSTEDAATFYVLQNKILFSLIDIFKLFDSNEDELSYNEVFDRATKLAQEKINSK